MTIGEYMVGSKFCCEMQLIVHINVMKLLYSPESRLFFSDE